MISYQTDGVEMPSIKKRETTEWIKSVAATYGKSERSSKEHCRDHHRPRTD